MGLAHSPRAEADLTNRFTYHPPTAEQPEVYGAIRDTAHLLALLVETTVPDGREKSLAFTAVEEAVMWANAGIARHGLRHHAAGPPSADDAIRQAITRLRDAKPHTPLLTVQVIEDDEEGPRG